MSGPNPGDTQNPGTDDSGNDERPPHPMDQAFLSNDPEAGRLILVRHGQQEWPNRETATVGDWVDPPLSDLGQRQAAAVANHLADEPITAVYSSALQRAFNTGRAIAEQRNAPHQVITELEEIQLYGKLPRDSRPNDVLGEKIVSGARQQFVNSRRWDAYPQSETSAEFRNRIGVAVEAAIADHPGETVVVACHAGVINTYLAMVLGLDVDIFYRPAHASVHRLLFKGSTRVIECLNEQTFLRDQGLLSV